MPGGRPKTKAAPDAVKSVGKVLDILEQVAAARQPVSVSDLARATGFTVSTAFRLVQTLVLRGYVEQEAGRNYVMGTRIYQLASSYLKDSDLATLARPQLEALRNTIGETVYLVMFSQGQSVQLCKADGPQMVSAAIRSSEREPAYCTATGKVLLSGLSAEAFADYLASAKLQPYTAQTITTRTKLEREIRSVREEGFALDLEEYADNLCCLAVPVRHPHSGEIAAAISVAMPKLRFKRSLVPRWCKLLEERAAAIAAPLALIDA